jgi:hypothetical protein
VRAAATSARRQTNTTPSTHDIDAATEGRAAMTDERSGEARAGNAAPGPQPPPVDAEESGTGVLCEPPRDIASLAALLSDHPTGFGLPIARRDAWDAVLSLEARRSVISRAEELLGEALIESPDDLYLDFSRTGHRGPWERVAVQRRDRVKWLVVAECLEDGGRFIGTLEETVRALCAECTWVMPAHDSGLANFRGTTVEIDLGSAHLGGTLATALYLLGDRLSVETRARVKAEVRRRITDPFREMATLQRVPAWWMLGTNNWNAVCLAGITVAALATLETREDRAFFIGAAGRFSHSFLKGFTADGYCTEGVGYWGYGFGNYVTLAEAILQATGGRVDIMARPEARLPALYGSKIEIIGGVCPAFADCDVSEHPRASVMRYVNRRFDLGLEGYDAPAALLHEHLYEVVMSAFAARLSHDRPTVGKAALPSRREWFEHAGVLICGPGGKGSSRFGVAMKGGNNAEHHNHNDVGSYMVVVGTRPVLLDPGGEVYTSRTFSHRRYESKVLNSYGHPVPVVAGGLQRQGAEAAGRVVRAAFTDERDLLELDIGSAYEAEACTGLTRTFVYSREGAGSLVVTDEVSSSAPGAFGTALVTLGSCEVRDDGSLLVRDGDEAVAVRLDVEGGAYEVTHERIEEDVKTPTLPLRIGIDMKQPVLHARVSFTITPVEVPGDRASAK